MYGAPSPFDENQRFPSPYPLPMPYTPPGIQVVQVPSPQPCVIDGLVALLPRLREALTGGSPLTADEAAAMAWLEGLAAGWGRTL